MNKIVLSRLLGYVEKLEGDVVVVRLWSDVVEPFSRAFNSKLLSSKGITEEGQPLEMRVELVEGDPKLKIRPLP